MMIANVFKDDRYLSPLQTQSTVFAVVVVFNEVVLKPKCLLNALISPSITYSTSEKKQVCRK